MHTARLARPIDRLMFVYSVESGMLHAFVDSARKILSLNGCSLCSITHGLAGEKSEWKTCKEELGVPVDYVHRDEVSAELSVLTEGRLPCIAARSGEEFFLLLTRDILEECRGSASSLKRQLASAAELRGLSFPASSGSG